MNVNFDIIRERLKRSMRNALGERGKTLSWIIRLKVGRIRLLIHKNKFKQRTTQRSHPIRLQIIRPILYLSLPSLASCNLLKPHQCSLLVTDIGKGERPLWLSQSQVRNPWVLRACNRWELAIDLQQSPWVSLITSTTIMFQNRSTRHFLDANQYLNLDSPLFPDF